LQIARIDGLGSLLSTAHAAEKIKGLFIKICFQKWGTV
jgi:hypothetical protein